MSHLFFEKPILNSPCACPAQHGELDDVRALIDAARQRAATAVNAQLTLLYWQIGRRIQLHVVKQQRAAYGEEILATLSRELTAHYGRGSSYAALTRMQREYYVQMCAAERWSVRTLRERIDSMLYERTALSQQPKAQIEQELATSRDTQRMNPALLLRDPYVLDFLGLRDTWARVTRRPTPLVIDTLKHAAGLRVSGRSGNAGTSRRVDRPKVRRRAPSPDSSTPSDRVPA